MNLQRRCCIAFVILVFVMTILVTRKDYRNESIIDPQIKHDLVTTTTSTSKHESKPAKTRHQSLQTEDIKSQSTTSTTEVTTQTQEKHGLQRYLWEQEITVGDSNLNILNMPNVTFSKMNLSNNKSTYFLGEEIEVNIHLFNGKRQRVHKGGDYLRLWMDDTSSSSAVSGDVIDHNNGSYTGILRALWTGQATIRLFLARNRGALGIHYKYYRMFSSLWWSSFAGFSNGKHSDKTECSLNPHQVDGKVCNFTHLNNGFAWFCKQPSKHNLTCKHWVTSSSKIGQPLRTEENILEINCVPKDSLFKVTLSITVNSDKKGMKIVSLPTTACSKIKPKQTWERNFPSGFFANNTWCSRLCSDTLVRSRSAYGKCLKDKTLWIPGDSTSFQFYTFLMKMLHGDDAKPGPKHKAQSFRDEVLNFEIKWHPHEMPFFNGPNPNNQSSHQAEHLILDNLPNTTQDIVVLYLYLHFTIVHPDVFRQHVRKLVAASEILLERAPNITLAIRGPHAFYKANIVKGLSSYWGLLYIDILHDEFYPLRHKVLYIDYWDMTVARASHNIHPPVSMIEVMVHYMMSLLCFRQSS